MSNTDNRRTQYLVLEKDPAICLLMEEISDRLKATYPDHPFWAVKSGGPSDQHWGDRLSMLGLEDPEVAGVAVPLPVPNADERIRLVETLKCLGHPSLNADHRDTSLAPFIDADDVLHLWVGEPPCADGETAYVMTEQDWRNLFA